MSITAMNHGQLTATVARRLRAKLESAEWQILFDHGNPKLDGNHVGKIVSWFGEEIDIGRRLAYVDIAVVKPDDRAFAIIEIEESAAAPKVLLGDFFGTLLGDHIKFKDRALDKDRTLMVGEWTTFGLFAHEQAHSERIAFLRKKVGEIKSHLSSGNASIGHVILETYDSPSDLEAMVTRHVEDSLRREST